MVWLAASQEAPDQTTCTTPGKCDATSPVNVGDTTSLMQVKQHVVKRANATSYSKGDDDVLMDETNAFCVSDDMVKAYNVPFRRHGANMVTLGCLGVKETGYFSATFACREQMSLWDGNKPPAVKKAGPTKMDSQFTSKFDAQAKAANAATGTEGSVSGSTSSEGSGKYEYMSQEFSSMLAIEDAIRASPKTIRELKRHKSKAKIVTGVLVLSAASSSTKTTANAGAASAKQGAPGGVGPTGEVSGSGSSTDTTAVDIPAGQTLAYELSEPEWNKDGTLLGLKKDPMCGRDDGWFGVCHKCGWD